MLYFEERERLLNVQLPGNNRFKINPLQRIPDDSYIAAALQFLKLISNSPSDKESSDDTIPSRIINSPRVRGAPDRYGQADTFLSDDVSNLTLEPQTPPNKSDRFSAASGPVLSTPASVSTMASPQKSRPASGF